MLIMSLGFTEGKTTSVPELFLGVERQEEYQKEPKSESEVKVKVKSLSRVQIFATPWTAAYQVPPSTGFSRQEYWSGVPFPSPSQKTRVQISTLLLSRWSNLPSFMLPQVKWK